MIECCCDTTLEIEEMSGASLVLEDTDGILFSADEYIRVVGGDLEDYTGPTEVIPSLADQILATKNKAVHSDITVKEIPYYEVSNTYGTTVNIGG